SELRVKSARKDRNGPAVGIVSGIVDELIVEGERRPFVEAVGVVRFEDLFPPIVELPIADQNTETASGEISARLRRETFDDASHKTATCHAARTANIAVPVQPYIDHDPECECRNCYCWKQREAENSRCGRPSSSGLARRKRPTSSSTCPWSSRTSRRHKYSS